MKLEERLLDKTKGEEKYKSGYWKEGYDQNISDSMETPSNVKLGERRT